MCVCLCVSVCLWVQCLIERTPLSGFQDVVHVVPVERANMAGLDLVPPWAGLGRPAGPRRQGVPQDGGPVVHPSRCPLLPADPAGL